MNTFQDQEYEEETGWVKFKWRNHDPTIGRFFNVDPLADKYVYNSPYAFSENHVTSHIELEGLEKVSIHMLGQATNDNGGQTRIGGKAVLDIGNNNRVDFALGSSSSNSVVSGSYDGNNSSLNVTQDDNFMSDIQNEISNPGIHVNDAIATFSMDNIARDFIDTGDEETNLQIQGVLTDAIKLVDEGLAEFFVGYDGTTTGGTDENGNPTVREFTGEGTIQTKPIEYEINGVNYSIIFQFTYTHENTTTVEDEE